MKQSPTNELTQRILNFLFKRGVFAWRSNVTGVPIHSQGVIVGMRPSSKVGVPDVLAVCPPHGRLLGIEIKTGKDKLRPEQIGFHSSARFVGAEVIVVKDWGDFVEQIALLNNSLYE